MQAPATGGWAQICYKHCLLVSLIHKTLHKGTQTCDPMRYTEHRGHKSDQPARAPIHSNSPYQHSYPPHQQDSWILCGVISLAYTEGGCPDTLGIIDRVKFRFFVKIDTVLRKGSKRISGIFH